jgi:hypothetical protein
MRADFNVGLTWSLEPSCERGSLLAVPGAEERISECPYFPNLSQQLYIRPIDQNMALIQKGRLSSRFDERAGRS